MNAGALEGLPKSEDAFTPPLWEKAVCLPVTVLTLESLDVKSPSRTPLTNSQVKDNIA